LAKSINVPILLIGHVTKSGEVAGPRTVEHSKFSNFFYSSL
jgi:DNA repair protein RadA/Sms